jgi:hypothetical protein
MLLSQAQHTDLVQQLTRLQDPGTVALTGETSLILVLAAIVALPVSMGLLMLYRRAVLRSMRTNVRSRTVEPLPIETPTSPNRPAQRVPDLSILDHASSNMAGPEVHALYSNLLRAPWRAAGIYVAAGMCYAFVMTALTLMSYKIEFLPLRFLLILWSYAWPVVLTVNLVAATTRRARLTTTAVYFLTLVAIGAIAIAKSPALDWVQVAGLWHITNLPATLLMWAFLNRRIRAVGPLVLIFLILALTGEFLDFLSGKLARRFIDGPQTLDLRVSEMDLERDRDGRFRVNDFFCHDVTWQMVLSRLEDDSDVVLMDLRGFSLANRGVIYEINELISVVPLERVVFVVDWTTDEEFLRQTVQECWERMKPSSPNRSSTPGQLRLFRFTGSHGDELRKLLHVLCGAVKPTALIEGSKAASV